MRRFLDVLYAQMGLIPCSTRATGEGSIALSFKHQHRDESSGGRCLRIVCRGARGPTLFFLFRHAVQLCTLLFFLTALPGGRENERFSMGSKRLRREEADAATAAVVGDMSFRALSSVVCERGL